MLVFFFLIRTHLLDGDLSVKLQGIDFYFPCLSKTEKIVGIFYLKLTASGLLDIMNIRSK